MRKGTFVIVSIYTYQHGRARLVCAQYAEDFGGVFFKGKERVNLLQSITLGK